MIQLKDKKDCCGCNACGDVCPHSAISFVSDNEGFWYPQVNRDLCVECGLCERVCPIIHISELKKNDNLEPKCFVAENKNISVVFSSTSGGLFSALAEIAYRDGAYVGGAVFNDDLSVKQIISDNREDLIRIRGSKYIQSDFSGFYQEVKELLQRGEKVLVCGGPCQMAALRAYLRKDYENLLIVDYICRGIGSPKVFRRYMDSFEERYGSPVVLARAKSKEYGWRNLTQKVVLADGREIFEIGKESAWTKQFNKDGLYHRPSCHDCQFKGLPRIADITIADFWGVESIQLDGIQDKDLGLSLALLNSKKGEAFFERIKKKINYQPVNFSDIVKGNRSLFESVQPDGVDRNEFYSMIDSISLQEAINKLYGVPPKPRKNNKIRRFLSVLRRSIQIIKNYAKFDIRATIQFFKYNSFSSIENGDMLIPTPHCIIHNEGVIRVKGRVILGLKKIPDSKAETRLWIERGGIFETHGPVEIGYGSDIQVFEKAHLIFEGKSNINSSAIIICAEMIHLGKENRIGRGVLFRDNNGKHYLDIPGYKVSSPIVTGDHIWYGEGCTIMQGVKIGDGAVIAAKAVVTGNVPKHTIVAGNPAQIVQTDIRWKF